MPMDRRNYSPDWPEISLAARIRAGWRCEWCGVAQGATTRSGGRVVLTVAHLNHHPQDNRPENLRALCQACHLSYDARVHAEHAAATRARKRADAARTAGQLALWDEG